MSKNNIFEVEAVQLKKLHEIVQKSIDEETLVIQNLQHPPLEHLTVSQKVSDKVATFGGSWKFIILFSILLAIWIIFNSLYLFKNYRFDPFPYILMNLILSCIAAFQAPIIMMSQNRKEEKDRQRSENDYLINLKAEMQVRSLNQKVDLLLEDQIKLLFDIQSKQMKLLNEIKDALNKEK